jgi:hypothetical protein
MKSILGSDWFRGIVFALLIIGILAGLFAVIQFVDASLRIQNNASYIAKSKDTPLEIKSEVEAQILMASDLEYRKLMEQRSNALIVGGGALVCLALGWIGNDFIRAQRRKVNPSLQSETG